ncbi:MAG: endonuclease III domain-containing protein [Candidatus Woesearchaeota archaeon]
MRKIMSIHNSLLKKYGKQGWWPIINNKTLLCEYHTGAPKNDSERFEICIGAILTQGTAWYPGVVRALQQLKLGRQFTKNELEVIKKAEIRAGKISEMPKIETKTTILTQNTAWPNVEKALINLKKINSISARKIIELSESKLKKAIIPAGYFNQKSKKLRIFSIFYISLNGRKPTRDELLSVWGIGKETADSILLYAYKKPVFVVDTYTKRVFSHLKLIRAYDDYDEIRKMFEKNLPKNFRVYQEFHALIVEHAKRCYGKKKEKNCWKN